MAFLDLLPWLPVQASEEDQQREPIQVELADVVLSASTQRIGWAVERLAGPLAYLEPSMPRPEWLRVLCGIHHEWSGTPEEGAAFDVVDAWSAGGTNYAGRSDVEGNWQSLGREGERQPVTLRSVVAMAKQRGYSARQSPPGEWQSRFRLETMADAAAAQPPAWLVYECLAVGTVNLLLGAPGNGKTLVAMQLGVSVARGSDFAGRDVRQGRVLYLAAEDPGSLRRRSTGLRCDYGNVEGFHLLSALAGAPNLRSRETEDAVALIAACREFSPALLIVDTFAAATPGADENSGKDMGDAYALLSELAAEGMTVLVLHHPRKGGTGDARGHGSQIATVATALVVEKQEGGLLKVSFVKARDASADQVFAFRIETREIGHDEKGRPLLAPIAVAVQAAELAGTEKRTAYQIARGAILPLANRGEGVTMADAVAASLEARVSKAASPDSRRRAAQREIAHLEAAGLLKREGDRLFPSNRLTEADADEIFEASA